MQEKIIHYWCDRCGAQYVPPQQDPKVTLAILRDDNPTAQEFLGMDLCPACEKEFNELIGKFKSTTGNKTISTEEKTIQSTSTDEVEPMGWEDWLEKIVPISPISPFPNYTPPMEIHPNYDSTPKCCRNCPNHPSNGGSGFCNCTLPYCERNNTTPYSYTETRTMPSTAVTTTWIYNNYPYDHKTE